MKQGKIFDSKKINQWDKQNNCGSKKVSGKDNSDYTRLLMKEIREFKFLDENSVSDLLFNLFDCFMDSFGHRKAEP